MRLALESSGVPGEGSTFSFTLPFPAPDAPEQAPNGNHEPNQLSASVVALSDPIALRGDDAITRDGHGGLAGYKRQNKGPGA